MRVAVTGATGFVGRHVLPLLLGKGWHVRALARDVSKLESHGRLHVVKGDLAQLSALGELCEGVEAVLHIAGAIAATSPEGFSKVNAKGTANMVAAARGAQVKRFVHVSSLAAREPGLSPYAASKAASEREVTMAAHGLSTLVLRPAAIYGEGDMATLPLIKALLSPVAVLPGKASGRFSLIHAGDFARVCIDALSSEKEGIIEIADGQRYSWGDVAATIRRQYGRPGRIIHIPQGVAMMIGSAGDLFARVTGKPAMVSRSKMAELYHPDWTVAAKPWPGLIPRPLGDGLAAAVAWYQDRNLVPRLGRIDGGPT